MNTTAIFFPFDLFGSGGSASGARLLADALREMSADNKREKMPSRARAYEGKVRIREFEFDKLSAYDGWRKQARQAIRKVWKDGDFLLWCAGNHLGVLPIHDELAGAKQTVVIQLDAHLDVFNLTDCSVEPSHGNFLLHVDGPLPELINLGSRDLMLPADHVRKHYRRVHPASELALDAEPALKQVRQASRRARRVFLDIDCDVFEPAYFPAVSHPQPFGLAPAFVLRVLDAIGPDKLAGIAFSEFDPARDRDDQSLGTLIWLLEYVLLKLYEK